MLAEAVMNALLPGSGIISSLVAKKKKEKQDFMSNPLNRLGATFGLVDGPKPLTGDDLGILGPLTADQQSNLDIANYLVGSNNASLVGGLGGKALSGVGSMLRGVFNAL